MSREIKFRSWSYIGKRMLYTGICSGISILMNEPTLTFPIKEPVTISLGKYELMQYAGFHDCNGKEIYEGDIVTNSVIKGVVAWSDNTCGFIIRFDECARRIRKCNQDDWKIVGNIYDNPEMVGGADNASKQKN